MTLKIPYLIFFIFFIQLETNCFSQTDLPSKTEFLIYQNFPQIVKKSVKVGSFLDSQVLNMGTGFFIKTKKQFYLVTCFHIVSGRESTDTTFIKDEKGRLPNRLVITFHSKNKLGYTNVFYDVLSGGKKKYTMVSSNVNKGINSKNGVSDLVFFPLGNTFDSNIIIDTTMIKNTNPPLYENDILAFFGYRHNHTSINEYCIVDTARAKNEFHRDKNFSSTNSFFYFLPSKEFSGNSGCPCYIYRNSKLIFLGMESLTVYSTDTFQMVYCTGISSDFIAKSIKKYDL